MKVLTHTLNDMVGQRAVRCNKVAFLLSHFLYLVIEYRDIIFTNSFFSVFTPKNVYEFEAVPKFNRDINIYFASDTLYSNSFLWLYG